MAHDEIAGPDWPKASCGRRGAGHAVVVGARPELCATCPIRLPCLRFAVRTGRSAGVWGGYAADDLRRMVHRTRHRRLLHTGPVPVPDQPGATDPAA